MPTKSLVAFLIVAFAGCGDLRDDGTPALGGRSAAAGGSGGRPGTGGAVTGATGGVIGNLGTGGTGGAGGMVTGGGGAVVDGPGTGGSGAGGGGQPGVTRTLALQVTARGKAAGAIRASTGAAPCSGACGLEVPDGARLVLTAEPAVGYWLEAWTGACASELGSTCTLMIGADPPPVGAIFTPANVAFVTSTARPVASFGGVAGADALCVERARAANLDGQDWKAWLATSTISPRMRFAGARGWVRPDGKPFADAIEDLTAQTNRGRVFYYPMRLDENGRDIPSGNIAACTIDGTFFCNSSPVCGPTGLEYTANVGALCWGRTDHSWELAGTCGSACGMAMHVVCLGTDYKARVGPPPPAPAGAKLAFVAATLGGSATVAGADALCASEARNAALGGAFQALVAPTGATAASRFDLAAGPYHRPDGMLIAATASDLFMGRITAPIVQSARGRYADSTNGVITGARTPFEVGSDANNCRNWGSAAPGDRMIVGAPFGTGSNFFNDGTASCSVDYYGVLCLQK